MKLHQKLGIVLKNQDLSSTYLLTILFTRFWMWLLMRFFAYLRYSSSMEHQPSQSYLTKLVGNRIWLQIEAEIQFADSTDSRQVCAHPLPPLSFQNNLALYSKLNSFSLLILFFQLTCHLNSTNENENRPITIRMHLWYLLSN